VTGFRRRIFILAVLALVVCLVVTYLVMRGRGWKSIVLGPAEVRVGAIGSMTSGLAQLGQRQVNSAILATEEWDSKGGITG